MLLRLLALPTRIRLGWKFQPGKNTSLLRILVNYGRKFFTTFAPALYKTLNIRNLREVDRFCIKLVSFVISVAFTGFDTHTHTHTLAYNEIRTL